MCAKPLAAAIGGKYIAASNGPCGASVVYGALMLQQQMIS